MSALRESDEPCTQTTTQQSITPSNDATSCTQQNVTHQNTKMFATSSDGTIQSNASELGDLDTPNELQNESRARLAYDLFNFMVSLKGTVSLYLS